MTFCGAKASALPPGFCLAFPRGGKRLINWHCCSLSLAHPRPARLSHFVAEKLSHAFATNCVRKFGFQPPTAPAAQARTAPMPLSQYAPAGCAAAPRYESPIPDSANPI